MVGNAGTGSLPGIIENIFPQFFEIILRKYLQQQEKHFALYNCGQNNNHYQQFLSGMPASFYF